jgi:DNA-directed RNA polymerase beta subunit
VKRIINPFYKLSEENIFNLRPVDYAKALADVREILKVTEEIGYTTKEFEVKESRFSPSELSYTLKNNLSVKLEKNGKIIDLSISIPKLINNNFVFINGRRKIPFFQLFDIPVIFRKGMIKIRTNVASITIDGNQPRIMMSFMGKVFPLSDILFAYYNKNEIEKNFENELNHSSDLEGLHYILATDIVRNYAQNLPREEYVRAIGKKFNESFQHSKGDTLVYALKILLKCDIMSARILGNDNVMEEIIKAVKMEPISDTDFRNKRLRCFEYIISSRFSKVVYDLCVTTRNQSKPKFNTNSSQIVNSCNVSDIVQFDFCINPIEELTKLSRCTLIGPGGFNKDNVPEYLRDIDESMFGRICPADTPDRENCGVQQSVIVNPNLNENLRFAEANLNIPISVATSMVPFLEHDDQTRLQMASSQMRQAVMLHKFDMPLIRSGCEDLYSKHTSFCAVAKEDGEVVFSNETILIVKYNSGEIDIFNIGVRNTYTENIDLIKTIRNVGDKFNKGDVLAESIYMKQGSICIGKNLLTAVASYYGFNYEDAIVISERLVKESVLSSVHYRDLSFMIPPDKVLVNLNKYGEPLKFLPEEGETIYPGQTYAKMKEIDGNSFNIFVEETELKAHKKIKILGVELYVNDYCKTITEYIEWVQEKVESQKKKEKGLQNCLIEILGKDAASNIIKFNNLNRFSSSNFKVKGEEFPGIFVKMYGYYLRPIQVGDKIGNRHGNKGVISNIVPEDKMPKLEDGRSVDIIVNPMGFISRMNTGQQFELNIAMSVMDLKINMKNMIKEGKSQEEIKNYILGYIKLLDVTEGNWYYNQFEKIFPETEIDESFIDKLSIIQAPFESVGRKRVQEILKYTNTPFKYKVYDPIAEDYFQQPLAVGYNYFFKMTHIAEEKMAARGIGLYNRRTLQPLSGKKQKGGQRMGEMEFHALIAHEGEHTIDECATTKSDCIDRKNKYIIETITSEDISYLSEDEEFCEKGESIMLLEAWLLQLGVKR